MNKTQIEYDELILAEIRTRIAEAIQLGKTTKDSWSLTSLQYCLTLIEQLRDENESLWFMIEEKKNSKWTKTHSEELQKVIDQQMAKLKLMQKRKGSA